jgi:hypothetical protein
VLGPLRVKRGFSIDLVVIRYLLMTLGLRGVDMAKMVVEIFGDKGVTLVFFVNSGDIEFITLRMIKGLFVEGTSPTDKDFPGISEGLVNE